MQGTSRSDRELLDAAALCRHLVAEDSVHAFLADHRQALFPDEFFNDLFASDRGRPSVPADVVATVMVLQALEGLSDRDAAMACGPTLLGRSPPVWRWMIPGSITRCLPIGVRGCGPLTLRSGSLMRSGP
jgi:hypothetical protein